jgi:hypothetical protein
VARTFAGQRNASAPVRCENSVVYASIDAGLDAEFVLVLTGMPAIKGADFVL